MFERVYVFLCRLSKIRILCRLDFKLYAELKGKFIIFFNELVSEMGLH